MAPIATDDNVGIIYPPPEVRNIVDKTASFVARNGPEFEQRIKQNEVNNPKFNFLNPGDPYHAYYQHKVSELRETKDEEKVVKTKAPPTSVPVVPAAAVANEAMKQRQTEILKQAQKEIEPPPPTEPPADFEFMADPPSISSFDLDIVKLTAQFVARNGRQFLTSLMQKEQRNYQFDFLRPQHSLFQYFTKLLEQYTKVLIPPKDLIRRLKEEALDEDRVKEEIDYRVRWVKHQEAKKQREAEELERERVSYAQIDWHSFVVVETVDYQPWEVNNFPPPTNPQEVGARVLMQRRVEQTPASERTRPEDVAGESNTNVEDMEEDSSSSEEEEEEQEKEKVTAPKPMGKPLMAVDAAPAVSLPPPPSLPTPGNVEVREYDPKKSKPAKVDKTSEEYLVSPITGERVPASKVQEHMRYGLLDSRWVEERDKQITARATEDQVFAPGQSIDSSLRNLAERRTDIFGVGEDADQEAAIGKKMGEEEKKSDATGAAWDGHNSTIEAAAKAARANISINDQIEQIHRNKGLVTNNQGIGPKSGVDPNSSATISSQPRPPTLPNPGIAASASAIQVPIIQAAPVPVMVPGAPPPPPQFYMAAGFAPPTPQIPQIPSIIPTQINPQVPIVDTTPVEEPAAKRPRGEDHLVSENEFLATNQSPVTFRVLCPQAQPDKNEWKLSGQIIQITLGLKESVSSVKARLHEETGMPPGKQKLQLDSLFMKDANSLAYYNIRPGTVVALQIKERGGRKK